MDREGKSGVGGCGVVQQCVAPMNYEENEW